MRYVIVGNGVAGTTAASNIRKIDPAGSITIISDEQYPFYSRIRLPEVLSGSLDSKALTLHGDTWYLERKIFLLLDTVVLDIDISRHEIVVSSNSVIPYDRLLLATGSSSFIPPVPGADKKGVYTLRTLKDAISIRTYLDGPGKEVVILGGGLLGLEAGHHILKAGHAVTVIESFPRLLPRQMDADGSEVLKKQMEGMGFSFAVGKQVKEIQGNERACGVELTEGTVIDCAMVLISAGVRPNISLAQKIGAATGRGIIVNNRMGTSLPDVYAAGDAVEYNNSCYGIWPAAERQGKIAGINMAGGDEIYQSVPASNILKVGGIDLYSAGDIDPDGRKESALSMDRERFIYKKLIFDENVLCGAILYGDINDRKKISRYIAERTDIGGIKNSLMKWDLSVLS